MMKYLFFESYIPGLWYARGGGGGTVALAGGRTWSVSSGSDTGSFEWDGDGTEIYNEMENYLILDNII